MNDELSMGEREFNAFRRLILEKSGILLSDSKQALLCSRLVKRVRALGLEDFAAYYRHLQTRDPGGHELRELVNAVTTNKTEFFREKHHFDFLREAVLTPLVERVRQGAPRRLRIWSAACSTGEEPYTIAMTVAETLAPVDSWDVRILASDIDTDVLARASRGRYPTRLAAPIPIALKRRWCRRVTEEEFEIDPRLRHLVAFRRINFIEEPWPIRSTFDVIFCRNVMIYFGRDTQTRIYEGFHRLLAPGGYLVAGHSENLHFVNQLFEPVGQTVYRRRGGGKDAPEPGVAGLRLPHPVRIQEARAGDVPSPQSARGRGGVARSPRSTRRPNSRPKRRSSLPKLRRVRIKSGEIHASREPSLVSTVLGSCVACCLHDPQVKVWGMNHFMLPTDNGGDNLEAICFGANAMELLINELLRLGAQRSRLCAKVFGASHVLGELGPIGKVANANARFIREFLAREGIRIEAASLGGDRALMVTFETHTGRAEGRAVSRDDGKVAQQEQQLHSRLRASLVPTQSNVTLF